MQICFLVLTLITGLFAIYFSIKNDVRMLHYFLFLVVIQNILVIIFCNNISTRFYTIFSVIKEVMLYLALGICLLRKRKKIISFMDKEEMFVLCFYAFILIKNLILTPASVKSSILSLRYILMPVLCIFIGRYLKISKKEMRSLFSNLVALSLFLAMFGIIEEFVLGDAFWSRIGYSQFATKMKGNPSGSLFNGVTVNFYTWDFFGIPIRRLVSITADPLATAFLIYLGVMILITKVVSIKTKKGKTNINKLVILLLLVSSILSLSKAIFVFFALTIFVCAYFFGWIPRRLLKIGAMFVSIVAILVLQLYISNATTITSSINHLNGLQNGFANSGFLGEGLGTAGATVIMLTGSASNITESYIGSLVYQIGILGLLVFAFFLYLQIKKLFTTYKKTKSNIIVLSLILIFGLCICMIFSESAVSIMGTGIYFIIIGLAQQTKLYIEDKKETDL